MAFSNEVQPMIKPGCTAYFYIPPVWIDSAPSKAECEYGADSVFKKLVFERTIIHGIKIRVRRDGLIVFDCRAWAEAGETEIPAHTREMRKPVPATATEAENLGIQRAQRRAQLINAHLACLCTALSQVRGRGQGISAFVYPFQAYQLHRIDDEIPRWDHDVVQRFVTSMTDFANPTLRRSQPFQQRLLYELDVLHRSFDLLEEIMRHPLRDLLDITELLYRAGSQYSLRSLQESLILAWGVCERFLNELWERYLEEQKAAGPVERVTSDRKKKLTGRDFTASIISESLELAGKIPFDLFQQLEKARKARNAWMHGLQPIGDQEANTTIRAATELYGRVTGVKLSLNFGYSDGSGGAAPKGLLEEIDRARQIRPAKNS